MQMKCHICWQPDVRSKEEACRLLLGAVLGGAVRSHVTHAARCARAPGSAAGCRRDAWPGARPHAAGRRARARWPPPRRPRRRASAARRSCARCPPSALSSAPRACARADHRIACVRARRAAARPCHCWRHTAGALTGAWPPQACRGHAHARRAPGRRRRPQACLADVGARGAARAAGQSRV